MDGYNDDEDGMEMGMEGYDDDLLEGTSQGSHQSAALGVQRMQVPHSATLSAAPHLSISFRVNDSCHVFQSVHSSSSS